MPILVSFNAKIFQRAVLKLSHFENSNTYLLKHFLLMGEFDLRFFSQVKKYTNKLFKITNYYYSRKSIMIIDRHMSMTLLHNSIF